MDCGDKRCKSCGVQNRTYLRRSDEYSAGVPSEWLASKLRKGMEDTSVLIAPLSSIKSKRLSTISVPWSILNEVSAAGMITLSVCFVDEQTYKFCAKFVTRLNRKQKTLFVVKQKRGKLNGPDKL